MLRKITVLESLFNKVLGLQLATLVENRLQLYVFSCEFCKIDDFRATACGKFYKKK